MSRTGTPAARGLSPRRVIQPARPMSNARRLGCYTGTGPEKLPSLEQWPALTGPQRRRARHKLNHALAKAGKPVPQPAQREEQEASPPPAPPVRNLKWAAGAAAAIARRR